MIRSIPGMAPCPHCGDHMDVTLAYDPGSREHPRSTEVERVEQECGCPEPSEEWLTTQFTEQERER